MSTVQDVTPHQWGATFDAAGYKITKTLWKTTTGEHLLVCAMRWDSQRVRCTKIFRADPTGQPLSTTTVTEVQGVLNPKTALQQAGYTTH